MFNPSNENNNLLEQDNNDSFLNDKYNQYEEIRNLFDSYDEECYQKFLENTDILNEYHWDDDNNKENQSTENTDKIDSESKVPNENFKENENENDNSISNPLELNNENNNSFSGENSFHLNQYPESDFEKEEKSDEENSLKYKFDNYFVKPITTIKDITKKNCDTNKNLRKKRNRNFTFDQIIKNIRILALKEIINFVNRKIRYFYNNNIGKGLKEKQFREISKKTLSHSNVGYDKEFLEFKLKEIFSFDISGKMTNSLMNHNKNLVELLLNSSNCSGYFSELFDLTFLQCLEHIQRKKTYGVLDGIMDYQKILEEFAKKKEIKNGEYYSQFEEVFINYQELIRGKTPRKPRKKC